METKTQQIETLDEDVLDDDFEIQLEKIAEQLATLSTSEEYLNGYSSATSDSFDAKEVQFSSNSWLLKLLQVQQWLNLHSTIKFNRVERDPEGVVRDLFEMIGSNIVPACYRMEGSLVKMTPEGAELLGNRIESAVHYQTRFHEALETLNRKQATEEWSEAWEEEEPQEASSEPIRAKSDNWRISDFVGKAVKENLNLSPSYQRGDVWPIKDSQKLIESILRGIPLPSIILLKPLSPGSRIVYEVVDGKQRLTSILRFTGKHPAALKRVREAEAKHPGSDLAELFKCNYKKFRKHWKRLIGEDLTSNLSAEYYFPFSLPKQSDALCGKLGCLRGKFFCEIKDESVQIGSSEETIEDLFEGPSEYKIALIEYFDATPKQIHDVFHLYNRQGMHLNAEEIRNALFHELNLVRLILVAAGDNREVNELVPFFPSDKRDELLAVGRCLTEYRFGVSRYKRTKMLSWLIALLVQPSTEGTNLAVRSTAKQIDTLFRSIQSSGNSQKSHWLSSSENLCLLFNDLYNCLDIHSSSDVWSPEFKDDSTGKKWQELQLIASLLGVILIMADKDNAQECIDDARDRLLLFTSNHLRPAKTQNKTQWGFIGRVALGIVDAVGIDLDELDRKLVQRYGYSCIPTLSAASKHFEER